MHQSRLRSWVRPPGLLPVTYLGRLAFLLFSLLLFLPINIFLYSSLVLRSSSFLSGTHIHAVQTFFPSVHCPLPLSLSLSLSPLIAKLSARNWCSGSPLEVDKNVPTVPSNLVQALVIVPIPNCFVNSLVKSNLDGKTGSSFEQSLMSKVVTRFCR